MVLLKHSQGGLSITDIYSYSKSVVIYNVCNVLCKCIVLSVLSLKMENYKNNKNTKKKSKSTYETPNQKLYFQHRHEPTESKHSINKENKYVNYLQFHSNHFIFTEIT